MIRCVFTIKEEKILRFLVSNKGMKWNLKKVHVVLYIMPPLYVKYIHGLT